MIKMNLSHNGLDPADNNQEGKVQVNQGDAWSVSSLPFPYSHIHTYAHFKKPMMGRTAISCMLIEPLTASSTSLTSTPMAPPPPSSMLPSNAFGTVVSFPLPTANKSSVDVIDFFIRSFMCHLYRLGCFSWKRLSRKMVSNSLIPAKRKCMS